MSEDDLSRLTKEEFDERFKTFIEVTEDQLEILHDQYISLLKFRKQYRQDYKTHRINHYLTEKGVLTYRKISKRSIGFNRGGEE